MKKRHLASFLCVQIMPVRDVYCQTLQKRSSCHFLARAQKRVDLISRFMMGNSVKHNNNKGSEKSLNCFLNTIFRRVNLGLSRCTMSLPSRRLFFVGFKIFCPPLKIKKKNTKKPTPPRGGGGGGVLRP
mgnify:CR=1 FL=1